MTPSARTYDAANLIHTAHLNVHEDHIEEFRERLNQHAQATRAEPGCIAFDVYQSTDLPSVFFLFEIYRDVQSLQAHRNSFDFLTFREDVDGWIVGRQWWYWSSVSLTQRD